MNKQRIHSKLGNVIVAAAAALLVGACASEPKVATNADRSVDFNAMKSYAFIDDLKPGNDAYQSLESTFIRNQVARQMEARGYVESASPDLAISYAIETQEKVRSRPVPTMGLHGGYYDPFYDVGYVGGYGYANRIDQYTEGKLVIAAVSTESNAVVWEASTRGRLTVKHEQAVEATLKGAVDEVFKGFPVPAAPAAY